MSDLPTREALTETLEDGVVVVVYAKAKEVSKWAGTRVTLILDAYASGRLVDRETGEELRWCVVHKDWAHKGVNVCRWQDYTNDTPWTPCIITEARLFVENPDQ